MQTASTLTSPRKYAELLKHLLPEQGAWTEEEYLWLTDSTTRLVEFTDGYIEVLPIPTTKHQKILSFLFIAFDLFLRPRGGCVLFSALRLRIREGKFREPDLLLLKSEKDSRLEDRFWTGADLVLEVVSKDKPERDLIHKRRDYAEGKVPEYWIVNPEDESILVLGLNGKRYKKLGAFRRGQKAKSSVLDGFEIDVSQTFDA